MFHFFLRSDNKQLMFYLYKDTEILCDNNHIIARLQFPFRKNKMDLRSRPNPPLRSDAASPSFHRAFVPAR